MSAARATELAEASARAAIEPSKVPPSAEKTITMLELYVLRIGVQVLCSKKTHVLQQLKTSSTPKFPVSSFLSGQSAKAAPMSK